MLEKDKMQQLLNDTKSIVEEQLKIEKEKGEKFNIFSILKMENKENTTHSAFLKELLNPSGSHFKDTRFLKLFLETIGNEDIDLSSAKVKTEHPIGQRDDDKKKGGRVDIYIWDNNKSLTIENKINAPDQNAQIERYCNYNKPNNKVYYLTLLGTEPCNESKGKLKSGQDFYVISYKKEIIEWLEKCLQISADSPILKESIKQYIILIKKITNTMDDSKKEELNKLMLKNFEEAGYIAANFINLKAEIGSSIRNDVMAALGEKLGDAFEIFVGQKIQNEAAQIWIKYKAFPASKLYFGVESFSYNASEGLFVGILNEEKNETQYVLDGTTKDDKILWPYWQQIESYEGHEFDFDKDNTLYTLYTDKEFKRKLITHIVNEVEKFILIHNAQLLSFLNTNK